MQCYAMLRTTRPHTKMTSNKPMNTCILPASPKTTYVTVSKTAAYQEQAANVAVWLGLVKETSPTWLSSGKHCVLA